MTIRIAMWSGPRNISTAMMRSWENREDCSVVDEPFYAYYLNKTQSPHPFFEEILQAQNNNYHEVAKQLTQDEVATGLQYQKHMTHHMLPGESLQWSKGLRHCFLIREPAQVVNSYTNSRGACSAEDIGIIRQAQMYQEISEMSDQEIPVLDSNDVLKNPRKMLGLLCAALGVEFDSKMLSWPKGRRNSDGVWAPHWYHSVEGSTGFAPFQDKPLALNSAQQAVVEEVMPYYKKLSDRKLGS